MSLYINQIYDQGNLGSCTANAFCQSHLIQQQQKYVIVKFQLINMNNKYFI